MAGAKGAKNSKKGSGDSGSIKGVKSLTIQTIAEVCTALRQAIADSNAVSFEMSEIEELDAAGLQLLCSAHRASILHNKAFCLVGGMPDSCRKIITDAGFQRHVGCAQDVHRTCLWIS